MREKTDTSRFKLFPAGTYDVTVLSRPKKLQSKNGKSTYRRWQFGTVIDDKMVEFEIFLFPWESEVLLLGLGFKMEGTIIDWDDEQVEGKELTIKIEHIPDKNGVPRAKITFAEERGSGVPF